MTLPRVGGRLGPALMVLACILLAWGASLADDLGRAIELTIQANKKAARSQKKIDKMSEDTSEMLGQYRAVLEQIESVRAYNAQVEKLLASQRQEIKLLEGQIENATAIGRDMTPLALRMLESLETFIGLDVPFLLGERKGRVAKLREMMDRADVTESEKFRRILEAFQIEVEFGHNIEAYSGELDRGESKIKVNFLRVGRVALVYLTLDETEAGAWDKEKQAWVVLPSEYRSSIKKGLRIARKQTAPDLIRLPVFAPEVAK